MKDNKKESKIILFLRNNKKLILSMLIFNIFFFILMFSSVKNVNATTDYIFTPTDNKPSQYITYQLSDLTNNQIDYLIDDIFSLANSLTLDNYIVLMRNDTYSGTGSKFELVILEYDGALQIECSQNGSGQPYRVNVRPTINNMINHSFVYSYNGTSFTYVSYNGGVEVDNSFGFTLIFANYTSAIYTNYSYVLLKSSVISQANLDTTLIYRFYHFNMTYFDDITFDFDNSLSPLNVLRGETFNFEVFSLGSYYEPSNPYADYDKIEFTDNIDSVLFYFKDYSTLSAANYIKTFYLNGLYEIYNFNFNNFISELDNPNFYLQYNTHYYKPTSEIGLRYGNRDLDVWGVYNVDNPFELIYQHFDGLGNTAPLFKAIYNVGENNMPSVKNYYYMYVDLSNVGYVLFDYNGYVVSTDNVDNSISYIDSDSNNVDIDLSPYVAPNSNLYDNIGSSFNNFLAPIGSIFHLVDYGVVNSGEIIQPFIFILLFLGVVYFVVKALL